MTRIRKNILLLSTLALLCTLSFCKKQTETYTGGVVADYYPMEVGKYIQYRLDSVVFTNFAQVREVHTYQVRDIVDAAITDNLGRPSFRIRRMIRDSAGTTDWADNATFMVTILQNSVEYVADNMRFIKMVSPVRNDYYWAGNKYIFTGADESGTGSELSNAYLDGWNYTYANTGEAFIVNNNTIDNTVTVLQADEATGDPIANPVSYADSTYSVEVYAKDVGLVYKDFLHWVYVIQLTLQNCRMIVPGEPQPLTCPVNVNCDSLAATKNGYAICDTLAPHSYSGYGIKLTMLEHN
ncbi:MAG: hypothetical protein QM802_09760 [Agriterribacter sp.]